jgi:superfamily I DNA and/or RNA helicase
VICLFSNTSGHGGLGGLGFLLDRRRLNVAISRAQTMCIVLSSDEVLRPPVALLADEGARKGYAFLREFERRAWALDVTVDLDPFVGAA